MARRLILSLSEREPLLALPDDELTLTRMAYFSEHDLALISARRKPVSRFGFATLIYYLKNSVFSPDKKSSPSDALLKHIASRLKLTGNRCPTYLSSGDTTRCEHLTELYHYLAVKAFTSRIQHDSVPMTARTDKGILLAQELLVYLRTLLVQGARSVMIGAENRTDSFSRWVCSLVERRGYWRAVVAIAAKNARLCWASLHYGDDFKQYSA